jgi:ubiquinone/menaquinone biosynthesis C-methylase UbiE
MAKLRNKIKITEEIVQRDKFRAGKNYYTSLRGYHIRRDILDAMFRSIEIDALPKNRRIIILDAGCGPGIVGDYVSKEMKKKHNLFPIVIFVDISEDMLRAVPKKSNYIIVRGDITKLEFPDNFFDIVVTKQVLHYLPKNFQLKAIDEFHRVLKRNGQLILSALISPDDNSNTLANYLYNERERIITKKVKSKKHIPTKKYLINLLRRTNFRDIKVKYIYDIPLSIADFKKAFGLDKYQTDKLNKAYLEVIKRDKKNIFKGQILNDTIELVEKGIIIKCIK